MLTLGGFFTWRNLRVAEANQIENQQANRKREAQTQEAQFTDRYAKAVEQLGSDQIEIRLGGIYALERLMRDSPRDYWSILDVLTTYIRMKSPWNPEMSPNRPHKSGIWSGLPQYAPNHDIQAIVAVIRRRDFYFGNGEEWPLNLSETDLRGANFSGAHLERADFLSAHLEGASFSGAYLDQAHFANAYLARTNFHGASTTDTIFYNSHDTNFSQMTTPSPNPSGE